jgi:heptosyltransferase II
MKGHDPAAPDIMTNIKNTILNENVLVWLPSPMGDGILCTPALRAIRNYFKTAKITFFANRVVREILTPSAYNDNWLKLSNSNPLSIAMELKKHRFTCAILLKNSFAAAVAVLLAGIHRRIGYAREHRGIILTDKIYPPRLPNGQYAPHSMIDYYLEVAGKLGAETTNKKMELFIDPQDEKTLREKLPEITGTAGPVIIIVPGGAFGPSKLWPAERFAQTADKLIKDFNATVIISVASTPAEKEIADKIFASSKYGTFAKENIISNKLINLAQKYVSLGELKPLFSAADLIITNDTGPRHIAAALHRKVVTIFGSSNPAWTETGYENEIKIISNVDCAPCHLKVCPKEHQCMNAISVDEVMAAAEKLLKK